VLEDIRLRSASASPVHHSTVLSATTQLTPSGGPYAPFAGKECSRALALMSVRAEDCNGLLSDLPEEKLKILRDWELKFMRKYPVVGAVAGSGVDLAQYQRKSNEMRIADDVPPPTGHNKPIVIGITAVVGAALCFGVSLLPFWGKQ
jgi:hypothetical protein